MVLKKTKKLSHSKRLEPTKPLAKIARMEWSRTSAMDVIRSKKSDKKYPAPVRSQ